MHPRLVEPRQDLDVATGASSSELLGVPVDSIQSLLLSVEEGVEVNGSETLVGAGGAEGELARQVSA